MDGGEVLQGLYVPEPRHRSFASWELACPLEVNQHLRVASAWKR